LQVLFHNAVVLQQVFLLQLLVDSAAEVDRGMQAGVEAGTVVGKEDLALRVAEVEEGRMIIPIHQEGMLLHSTPRGTLLS